MWAQSLVAPRRFELLDVPAPDPNSLEPGEVLLEYLASAVCGSDLPRVRGFINTPHERYGTPGWPTHEIVGRVIASRDPRHQPGQRVVGWAPVYTGLAEQFKANGFELLALDPAVTGPVGTVVQATAPALKLADRVGDVRGKRVAIIGQGAYGLLIGAILHRRGAAHVTGIDPIDRREEAHTLGIDTFVREAGQTWAAGLSEDDRPDIVIEAVGHQQVTVTNAIEAVKAQGKVCLFGLPDEPWYALPYEQIFRKGLTLAGGDLPQPERIDYLGQSQAFIQANPAIPEVLITAIYHYTQAGEAFTQALVPRQGQLKLVITT
ncbi:MAG: zinc-binding dehydrogenase [Bifidobacteriaceae bacterium]|jgi:threonine dehydrogenase-like Zn-dependent dehydrogenase|nr:zinc-binding dehydrogenase [Bifidobacteriaceae bacterium]